MWITPLPPSISALGEGSHGSILNGNYAPQAAPYPEIKQRLQDYRGTDKLRSYGAARRDVMPAVEHRSHKGLNNRAENSHVPLRKRERMMQGFRNVGGLQRFISVFSAIRNLFVAPHQKRSALATHIHRIRAMTQWKAVTGATA